MKHRLALFCATAVLVACAHQPTGLDVDRSHASPGFESRVQFVVLHYTALDQARSLQVLTQPRGVSAHYLVGDAPVRIYQLVDEQYRSWHAGVSHWGINAGLNSSSIGIEIVNPGYKDTPQGHVYAPYPKAQIDAVIALLRDISARHRIRPERILGHADLAPGRKQDPGPQFPWRRLADEGLIPWPDAALVAARRAPLESGQVPLPDAVWVQTRLAQVGYKTPSTGQWDAATREVLSTFQMKYRPANFSGALDAETAALLDVATTPGGMRVADVAPQRPARNTGEDAAIAP
ncbi:N-acetylmuramoyl-L-alanine amidase [Roseateles sp. BYS180W]|uniref:N-acetylmuramoyl-L-alanine amidase n=1 Tax=Roseateles rivi TaxID=3299028 RepID=A0ABW7FUD1_9BURK